MFNSSLTGWKTMLYDIPACLLDDVTYSNSHDRYIPSNLVEFRNSFKLPIGANWNVDYLLMSG